MLRICFPVSVHCHYTLERIRACKKVLVDHTHLITENSGNNTLIIELDLLHLWGRLSVSSIDNTVCTELIVCGTVAKIASVGWYSLP